VTAYWLARLTAPLAFATRAGTARKLFRFALAEHESMLELRAAAARCASPERRALYLRHALDEQRHATTFARHAAEIRAELGRPGYGAPRTDCEGLYERLGEVGFLAFVQRGEARGRAQFEAYREHFARKGDEKLRALFTALIGDERGHEAYTRELLVERAGGDEKAVRALVRASLWEGARSFRRSGQSLAGAVYVAGMVVLYAALLPFALLVRIARPSRGGSWS
jgi:hypothetical protein